MIDKDMVQRALMRYGESTALHAVRKHLLAGANTAETLVLVDDLLTNNLDEAEIFIEALEASGAAVERTEHYRELLAKERANLEPTEV